MIFNTKTQSIKLFDAWSFIHINTAMLLTYALYPFFKYKTLYIVFFLTLLFELIENSSFGINAWKPLFPEYNGDSYLNIVGDLISNLIGIYIAYYLIHNTTSFTRSLYLILLFLLLEFIPTYTSNLSILITLTNHIKYLINHIT